jgi:transposase
MAAVSSVPVAADPGRASSTAPPAPACSAPPIPHGPCPVCPRLAQEFEPWRQAGYWKALHDRAVQREALLKQEIEQLRAQLRLREQQLFGRKAETTAATTPTDTRRDDLPHRPRGQQRGRKGPRRRDYAHLPVVIEEREIPGEQCCCRRCGRPFAPASGTEDSTILEVEVKAHRRLIRRHRYRPTCGCGAHPGVVAAPPAPPGNPKSILGVSLLVEVLLDKYLSYRPTYRLLADRATRYLDLSLGTLTDALQRLLPLFEPVYEARADHSRRQPLWHGDETRWLVFATVEGKAGFGWYLWVFHSEAVVVFVLAQGRAHAVPEQYLGPQAEGILVVDRYKAYQAIDQVKRGLIVLAFCWAHVRRDFVTLARTWPEQEGWALGWVERIGQVYRLNDERRAAREEPVTFAAADARLRAAVTALEAQGASELTGPPLHPARRRVLESLGDHWTALTVFVEHPEVPLDNNTAERAQRGPLVGRKNYYGSGAVWAGRQAAMMFSLLQTMCLWQLNPRAWLTAYLTACAEAGGEVPEDVGRCLPWNLSDEDRHRWSLGGTEAGADTS